MTKLETYRQSVYSFSMYSIASGYQLSMNAQIGQEIFKHTHEHSNRRGILKPMNARTEQES